MDRIIIVHWNKSTGPEPIIQYPPEKKLPSNELFLKIWALHELDKESSMIDFIPEINEDQFTSIFQQYQGEIYFIIIEYRRKDNVSLIVKDHPDILAIISKNLVELINTNKITRAISEAFYTIKNYAELEKEENLLNFFRDKIKETILKILQDGVISKEKMTTILRREYGFSTINIDLLLIAFIRENLIIKKALPGIRECYFLIKDLSCLRVPPNNASLDEENDEVVLKDYKQKLIDFYSTYDCISEIENKSILTLFMDKEVYELVKNLRRNVISVSTSLDILNNKEDLFNELLDKKIIYEAKGRVYLFSDIRFVKFLPYFLIEKLAKRYLQQKISFDEYITHLKLLSEESKNTLSAVNYELV